MKCIHLACNCKVRPFKSKLPNSFLITLLYYKMYLFLPERCLKFFFLWSAIFLPSFVAKACMHTCIHFFLPILCPNCSPKPGTETAELLGGGDGWVEQKLHFPLKGRGRSAERTERPFIPIKKRRGKSSSQWRWKILYLNPGKNLFFLHCRIVYSQYNSNGL